MQLMFHKLKLFSPAERHGAAMARISSLDGDLARRLMVGGPRHHRVDRRSAESFCRILPKLYYPPEEAGVGISRYLLVTRSRSI